MVEAGGPERHGVGGLGVVRREEGVEGLEDPGLLGVGRGLDVGHPFSLAGPVRF